MKNMVMLLAAALSGGLVAGGMMPESRAEAFQAAPFQAGGQGVQMVTGGATPNQQDLCWLLTKVRIESGLERTVLMMYKAQRNGTYFDLIDSRWVDPDFRVAELQATRHNPTVQQVLQGLPPKEQAPFLPPKKEEKKGEEKGD